MENEHTHRVPVSFFAVAMGTAGLSLAWRQAADYWDTPGWLGTALWLLACALWLAVCTAYVVTSLRFPGQARAELYHHGTEVFAALAFMSLMLLTIPLKDYAAGLAETLWFVAALSQAALGAWMVNRWVREPVDAIFIAGGWLLPPTGGNLIAAIGASAFGHDTLAYMFLGAGAVSWIFVNSLIFARQVTHPEPLTDAQRPSVFIQVAPPVLIVNAIVPALTEEVGPLEYALWGFALFALVSVLFSTRRLLRAPFGPHWWAMTFPSAAFALASLRLAQFGGEPVAKVVAPVALAFATLLIAYIMVRSALALREGRFVPTVPA